jgi:hypothetical protein
MNTAKQFWTLVKFQFLLYPVLWFLPMIIGVSSLVPFLIKGNSAYHSSLSFYFSTSQNFFFVGIFGSMIIAPEKFQFNRMRASMGISGTEFFLTRAIDRPVLYRAKAFLLYALILLLPLGTAIYFLPSPELVVRETSKIATQQVLDHIPGSQLSVQSNRYLQPNITLPYGKVLIAESHVWVLLLAIMLLQLLVALLSPYKFGKPLFWGLCYLGLFGPVFFPLFEIERGIANPSSPTENLFYFFVGHQPAVWICTLFALILCQLFCERDFARQEQ